MTTVLIILAIITLSMAGIEGLLTMVGVVLGIYFMYWVVMNFGAALLLLALFVLFITGGLAIGGITATVVSKVSKVVNDDE